MHGTWPELLRRLARELNYDDRFTLRALRFSEYHSIDVTSRLKLLAFVCDQAASTLTARRIIDKRAARLEETPWDWSAAVSAGLVQHLPLCELPRPEPLGRDKDHGIWWRASSTFVFQQLSEEPQDEQPSSSSFYSLQTFSKINPPEDPFPIRACSTKKVWPIQFCSKYSIGVWVMFIQI